MAKWTKTTPYGDYKETKDRKTSRTNRNVHIIREAKSIMVAPGRHAGSKPLAKLLKGIAKAHEAKKDIKEESKEESENKELS